MCQMSFLDETDLFSIAFLKDALQKRRSAMAETHLNIVVRSSGVQSHRALRGINITNS